MHLPVIVLVLCGIVSCLGFHHVFGAWPGFVSLLCGTANGLLVLETDNKTFHIEYTGEASLLCDFFDGEILSYKTK